MKTGDKVIKNPETWIPNEFDEWGRGEGEGEVVATLPDLDVKWPAGRCYENIEQLIIV